jgi:hypothetical protein
MKIGIMTFWWSEDNYGQILQAYALQKYLRDMGHDAYLIRYDPKQDNIPTPVWKKILKACNFFILFNFISYRFKEIHNSTEQRKHPRNFGEFRQKYIKWSNCTYFSLKELIANPPEADIYITGSDQVWNTFPVSVDKVIDRVKAYLLDFGNESVKRYSYAASFGKKKLDDRSIEVFSPLLKNFDYISVREKTGLDICKQCGINNAKQNLDPTMLLDAKEYRYLYKHEKIRKPYGPYCFLYILGHKQNFKLRRIYQWAKKHELEIIYISGNLHYDKYKKTYATIPEWLYLIDNAEYVITNSFHGSVFSILFHKQFAVIPTTGSADGFNTRLFSLFDILNIKSRFLDNELEILDAKINWDKVSEILNRNKNDVFIKNFGKI